MVGRALALALVAIHHDVDQSPHQGLRQQDVVDPEAAVLGEAQLSVVPPGERLLVRVQRAEAVGEPPGREVRERLALFVAAEDLAAPGIRIVNVDVRRRDVEVPEQGQGAVRARVHSEEATQACHPVELVGVAFAPHGSPVGTHTPDALTAYAGGFFVTEIGSIVFLDAKTTFVAAFKDTVTTSFIGNWKRVAGTHYIIDDLSGTLPTLPDDSTILMRVVTAGGSVTVVDDLRILNPIEILINAGIDENSTIVYLLSKATAALAIANDATRLGRQGIDDAADAQVALQVFNPALPIAHEALTLVKRLSSVVGNNSLTKEIFGLKLSNNVTDADHDLDVTAGNAFSFASGVLGPQMVLASDIVKRIDDVWVAGTGNGGLDTGTVVANEGYGIFLIDGPTVAEDVIISLDMTSTADTLAFPANYTRSRLIGWVRTDTSANILPFLHVGDYFNLMAATDKDVDEDTLVADVFKDAILTSPPLCLAYLSVSVDNADLSTAGFTLRTKGSTESP